MLENIRFLIAVGAFAAVLHFGRLIHRASMERLGIERKNNLLLMALGVRLDSIHARVSRLEKHIGEPPTQAHQHQY